MHSKVQAPLQNAHRLLAPRIAYLITSVSRDGESNVAPISNVSSVSTDPQRVVVAIVRDWKTFQNIESTKEFVINVPDKELLDQLWICGDKYWNNPLPEDVHKPSFVDFSETPARVVRVPLIADCYGHLECRVSWIQDVGNHSLILGDIVAATYQEGSFREDLLLDLKISKPIMQITGNYFSYPVATLQVDVERIRDLVRTRLQRRS